MTLRPTARRSRPSCAASRAWLRAANLKGSRGTRTGPLRTPSRTPWILSLDREGAIGNAPTDTVPGHLARLLDHFLQLRTKLSPQAWLSRTPRSASVGVTSRTGASPLPSSVLLPYLDARLLVECPPQECQDAHLSLLRRAPVGMEVFWNVTVAYQVPAGWT